jgi:hypothetical protein
MGLPSSTSLWASPSPAPPVLTFDWARVHAADRAWSRGFRRDLEFGLAVLIGLGGLPVAAGLLLRNAKSSGSTIVFGVLLFALTGIFALSHLLATRPVPNRKNPRTLTLAPEELAVTYEGGRVVPVR